MGSDVWIYSGMLGPGDTRPRTDSDEEMERKKEKANCLQAVLLIVNMDASDTCAPRMHGRESGLA
jgi:hypothetical protein